MNRFFWSTIVVVQILVACLSVAQASTKEEVRERGLLLCGVSTGIPGFSNPNERGGWSGLDVDICRAVAAALLGNAAKVKYIPLMARERFTALLSGEVDLLARNTTWTLSRDAALGLHFTTVSFYDRQGFLVSKKSGIASQKELHQRTICSLSGTVAGPVATDEFYRQKIELKSLTFETSDLLVKAFDAGRCDGLTSGVAQLIGIRKKLASPEEAVILPERIGVEPLGPAVRQGDSVWFSIVKWSLFAMINAEDLKISSDNVDTLKMASDPRIKRFLGVEGTLGKGLGLSNDWAYQIIKQVGNYGESFDRNVGMGSPLHLKRGLNELWSRGGMLFAPELR